MSSLYKKNASNFDLERSINDFMNTHGDPFIGELGDEVSDTTEGVIGELFAVNTHDLENHELEINENTLDFH